MDQRLSACSFTSSHAEPGEHRLSRLLVPEDANTSARVWSRVDKMPHLERDLQDIVVSGLENVLGSGKVQDHKRFDEPSIRHPYAQVGNIVTVDRDEIDGFLSIKGLVEKYLERPEWKRPLSLVVFGPPGSGKGFTVKQILSGIRDIDCKRSMTVNLSQFSNISELARVFHQIQDRALSGEIPLVFFDE